MKLNEYKNPNKSDEHFQAIYNSCNKLFASPVFHVLQLDEYYDTPDGQLKNKIYGYFSWFLKTVVEVYHFSFFKTVINFTITNTCKFKKQRSPKI